MSSLVYAFLYATPAHGFPVAAGGVAAVAGSVLVIGIGPGSSPSREECWTTRFLSHQACVFLGKVSYPLYLWHHVVFVGFRWARIWENPAWTSRSLCAIRAAAVVLALRLAVWTYQHVERRAQAYRRDVSPGRVILAGLLSACSVVLGVGVLQTEGIFGGWEAQAGFLAGVGGRGRAGAAPGPGVSLSSSSSVPLFLCGDAFAPASESVGEKTKADASKHDVDQPQSPPSPMIRPWSSVKGKHFVFLGDSTHLQFYYEFVYRLTYGKPSDWEQVWRSQPFRTIRDKTVQSSKHWNDSEEYLRWMFEVGFREFQNVPPPAPAAAPPAPPAAPRAAEGGGPQQAPPQGGQRRLARGSWQQGGAVRHHCECGTGGTMFEIQNHFHEISFPDGAKTRLTFLAYRVGGFKHPVYNPLGEGFKTRFSPVGKGGGAGAGVFDPRSRHGSYDELAGLPSCDAPTYYRDAGFHYGCQAGLPSWSWAAPGSRARELWVAPQQLTPSSPGDPAAQGPPQEPPQEPPPQQPPKQQPPQQPPQRPPPQPKQRPFLLETHRLEEILEHYVMKFEPKPDFVILATNMYRDFWDAAEAGGKDFFSESAFGRVLDLGHELHGKHGTQMVWQTPWPRQQNANYRQADRRAFLIERGGVGDRLVPAGVVREEFKKIMGAAASAEKNSTSPVGPGAGGRVLQEAGAGAGPGGVRPNPEVELASNRDKPDVSEERVVCLRKRNESSVLHERGKLSLYSQAWKLWDTHRYGMDMSEAYFSDNVHGRGWFLDFLFRDFMHRVQLVSPFVDSNGVLHY